MKSMLLIDGSEIISRLFAEIFEKRGWNVAICGDRDCAMGRLAGSDPYDVVLLSYRVPGTDGVKLVRFIRALEHRMTAAVVMVTGNHEVTEQAKAAGADEVLLKPINPNALIYAVDRHVSEARSNRWNGRDGRRPRLLLRNLFGRGQKTLQVLKMMGFFLKYSASHSRPCLLGKVSRKVNFAGDWRQHL